MQILHLIFELPFRQPILIFTVMLLIMLLLPLLLNRLKIPAIIGLILAGTAVGKHGFGITEPASVSLFSNTGLLYLMFLAGLEIDLHGFARNKKKSAFFGAATFFIPLLIGMFVCTYVLEFEFLASLLIAGMLSTHTLISYPTAARLDITKTDIVTIAIGGTLITDVAVLLMLSVISALSQGHTDGLFWLQRLLSAGAFVGFMWFVLPAVSRLFFRYLLQGEAVLQYVFVLTAVLVSGVAAELAGIEAIIGAFFAGLSLNKLIPHSSSLMNRIVFIGNSLFIPFFLISVGMVVNPAVLFDSRTWITAGVLIPMALIVKYLAAWLTQKVYRATAVERNVLFGLSASHAAATLAVIFIGFELKLFGEEVLNASILLILITCMVSTAVTEFYGKKLALAESETNPEMQAGHERLLVPISNPATIDSLIDFALMIKNSKSKESIYSLSVVPDDSEVREQLLKTNRSLERAVHRAASADVPARAVLKIEIDAATGISKAAKELLITKIVMGWNARPNSLQFFFGTLLEKVLKDTEQMVWVVQTNKEIKTDQTFVFFPPYVEAENGFETVLTAIKKLAKELGSGLTLAIHENSLSFFEQTDGKGKSEQKTVLLTYKSWKNATELIRKEVKKEVFLVVVSARKDSVSHARPLERMPDMLAEHFSEQAFAIVYPPKIVR